MTLSELLRGAGWRCKAPEAAALGTKSRYAPWREPRTSRADGCKGRGEIEQRYLVGSKRHARHLRKGRAEAELARGAHDVREPNVERQPDCGELDEIAWYRANSGERLHRGGEKAPNAWGLYDMLGNAWEWCFDIYDAEVYRDYRVIKGGGWFDEHWSCRAGVRRRTMPTLRIDDLSFRLARNAT